MLQRPTPAFLASKQPAVENNAFLTVTANPLFLPTLLPILPRVYNHSVPAVLITCICFEFLKNMYKTSLHTGRFTHFIYVCVRVCSQTYITNIHTERDVAWPVVDICKPGKENMNCVLWNCSLAATQNSCGYPSLCLAVLAVGWSTEYVMRRQQASAGDLFVQGMTSPFRLSDRLRICKVWRLQAAKRQRAFKRKRIFI